MSNNSLRKSIHHQLHRNLRDTLISARKDLGLTQRDLAKQLGVTHSIIGKIETGSTPSSLNREFYGDDFPFYTPADLKQKQIFEAKRNLSILGLKHSRSIPENSILVVCIGGSIGKTSMIMKKGSSNQQINAIIPNTEKIIPDFLYYYVSSNSFQNQIISTAKTGSLPILKKSKFSQLTLLLPSLLEQKQIIQNIKNAEEKFKSQKKQFENIKNNYESKINYINHIQSSVLDTAFSGKLVN